MHDIARALECVVGALDRLAIPYMVGGSVASSARGVYRATNDVDIVVRISERDIPLLVSELEREFYADSEMMFEALRHGRPFNLIHYASSSKFDLFPVGDDPYSQMQLDRAGTEDVILAPGATAKCRVASAEDIILAKLVWYRLGGEQSDQQWKDLGGIAAVQGARLDQEYLKKWAAHLGVEDLLKRLLARGGSL